ncbi:MAG: hypothetical protein HC866_23225 [Leptolyngbyaceae cyanobacterium RU_5_1]|nr:hypothetical protein [Leptolyngbyaceae cyanobacterium RU_5_1]
MEPEDLDQFFPRDRQHQYVSTLLARGGVTRRRAEYFVRLWAYLLLKQQQEQGQRSLQPLTQLYPTEGSVSCTHREAAELFYGQKDRGSDRAAGMMIDRLVALGLIEKRFDGQTLCLQVQNLPELLVAPAQPQAPIQLEPDAFNPRTDAVPAANLIARTYAELIQSNRGLKDPAAASHKIARVLRTWSQQYTAGIRVLRRRDNRNPAAISVFYPITSESEVNFFQPFNKGVYLTADTEADPFKPAIPDDLNSTAVYVRAWVIEPSHLRRETLCLFLEDAQHTLSQMREDFPNLCDLYSAFIHPAYEELKLALGFQSISHDPQRAYSWNYLALDHFLELDVKRVVANLKFGSDSKKA